MIDPEIVHWLAERVMGWPGIPFDNPDWNPLTDSRATEQVMEALQAQGFRYWIQARQSVAVEIARFGGKMTWKTADDWKRAFCLAAVEATGGKV